MSDAECYFCDETEVLERHHVVPRRHGGSDREENLVTLCPTCHRKIEKLYNKRFYTALGVGQEAPGGLAFVRELMEIEFPYSPQDVYDQHRMDLYFILSHFGVDADRYICDGCGRPTIYLDTGDGVARCAKCNSPTDGDADYTQEQAIELFGEDGVETEATVHLTSKEQRKLIKMIKNIVRERAPDDRHAGVPVEDIVERVTMDVPEHRIISDINKLRDKGELYDVVGADSREVLVT